LAPLKAGGHPPCRQAVHDAAPESHTGAAGCCAFAYPEHEPGHGYVMNRMGTGFDRISRDPALHWSGLEILGQDGRKPFVARKAAPATDYSSHPAFRG
jgi:hypothetical protein